MTLSPAAFTWVADLVLRESAIQLPVGKEYLAESRLLPLARAAGFANTTDYVEHLRRAGTAADREGIVEAMTTNETSWFRDREPFDVLVEHMIPDLLQRNASRRQINIWSAACSSGQEAYTIAMLMAEHVRPLGWTVNILATDIAANMLERTQRGQYSQLEIGRGLPAPLMVRHFERAGAQWQVKADLRSMVRVQKVNLAAPFPPLPTFDIVFLRNVLIYFDAPTKRQVLQRIRQTMSPHGFLVLGAAETTLGIDTTWHRTPVGRMTLNRPTEVAAPAAATSLPHPASTASSYFAQKAQVI